MSGPGAAALLQRLSTGDIASKKNGAITFTLLLDEKAGVRSDIFVTRLRDDAFQLAVNGPADLAYLSREAHLQGTKNPNHSVQVRDITGGTCCIGLWGPRAADVITTLTADDLSDRALPYSHAKQANIAGVPATVARTSFVGERGWEIHASAEFGLRLWDALWLAGQPYGVVAAGRAAFSALRMEAGFRTWGADVTAEHNPFEAGLASAIDEGKAGYVGHAAVQRLAREEVSRRLRCLTVDDGRSVVMGKEPVYVGDKVAGYVTSAVFGYTVGKPVAYAYLPVAVGEGDAVEIEYFGRRVRATVTAEPLHRMPAAPSSTASRASNVVVRARL